VVAGGREASMGGGGALFSVAPDLICRKSRLANPRIQGTPLTFTGLRKDVLHFSILKLGGGERTGGDVAFVIRKGVECEKSCLTAVRS